MSIGNFQIRKSANFAYSYLDHHRYFFFLLRYRIGNGSWVTAGVMTDYVDVTEGNITSVQCTSTHLTSFAVLVSVAGLEVHM